MKAGCCWRSSLIFALHLVVTAAAASHEVFDEDLSLRPLRDGKLMANFQFTTHLKGSSPRDPQALSDDDNAQHYTVFPLALGQLLREYAVTELHLSLNAGRWDYDAWGYPEESGVGTGGELWAWMGESTTSSLDRRWSGLRNGLGGLFCASLGHLDEQRTTSPYLTFQPEGALPNFTYPHQLRHAILASQHVCTENLTPFLKLLPCKSSSGIATLLNPHKLFDADWHGLSVHVRYIEEIGVELRLTFQGVFDPVRYSHDARRDWSLHSLFDRTIERACPVARRSKVRVELPGDPSPYSITPDPTTVANGIATYEVDAKIEALDVALRWPEEEHFVYPKSSEVPPLADISVHRTLKGVNQANAQFALSVRNNLPVEVRTGYLETMPWHLQFYLHTLEARVDGVLRDDLVSVLAYTPPEPHGRPALLQAALTLPAHATLVLTMDVAKAFLRYTEHQPDAQRGWDLPPAVLAPFAFGNGSALRPGSGRSTRVYTPALLVDLATPDFSMPYNVIIMSCTLIALIFGSVFNQLTRRFVVVRLDRASATPDPKADAGVAESPRDEGRDR
ncbi:Gpi16 subunit GPI transamidase component [Epithele typhae]|uniref:Gpi16 subunit GPI transamidase component n=1 Tax=Epithele typhae TaxID=378194 RepID=UPI0020079091|nr:Gpi16 subunit GPI transamidase component [Epithele typhae]KAH9919179.1 Gpi16 subunit GPI transamidase component [Epithele typhae]